jgi:LuxR family maltose regulon positive regulatory protein
VRSEIGLAAALAHAEYAAVTAAHDDDDAFALIDAAADRAQRNHRRVAEIRTRLLRAHLLHRGGRKAQAAELARSELQLAHSLGLHRLVPDLAPAVRESLHALAPLLKDAKLVSFMNQARPATNDIETLERPFIAGAPATTLEEKLLTVREREILQLLGRALSTKSIARELNLSPGTVKWHLRNIYGKLGAFSKEDALSKAREPVGGTRRSP